MSDKPPKPYKTWLDMAVATFPNTNGDIGDADFNEVRASALSDLSALREAADQLKETKEQLREAYAKLNSLREIERWNERHKKEVARLDGDDGISP